MQVSSDKKSVPRRFPARDTLFASSFCLQDRVLIHICERQFGCNGAVFDTNPEHIAEDAGVDAVFRIPGLKDSCVVDGNLVVGDIYCSAGFSIREVYYCIKLLTGLMIERDLVILDLSYSR
jgi:hypothetical protein